MRRLQEAIQRNSYAPPALYRLTQATTTGSTGYPQWGLSMTYDRYGNRTAQSVAQGYGCTGCPTNSVSVSAATNRITTTGYAYDAAGRLLTVTQNAQGSSTQTRTYAYDLAGRMTSEANPESGTTSYVYDSNSTCGTSSGDLVKRTDAVGNVTCYAYDALHRVTSTTYPSGTYANPVTSNKYFVYDSATVNSVAMTNAKGRLAEAYTCGSSCSSKLTDVGFSYTARGEVSDVYQSTPHSSGYYHVAASYWANGPLNTLNMNLSGVPNWTYGADSEGRPSTLNASSGQNPATSTSYDTAGHPTGVTLGSSDSDSFTYDANTGRMTQYKFTVGATPQSVVGNLTWNQNGSLQQLQIIDPFNSADAQTCTFLYDDLARIGLPPGSSGKSVDCGASTWQQNFSYDAFGNITKTVPTGGTGTSFQPTYSSSTNQMTTLPGFTPSYDSSGNVLNDSFHQYTWDSEGRPLSVDSVTLTYDALGRMVEQTRTGPAYTQIVYAPGGGKIALMNGQTLSKAFVGLPGGGTAVYNSSGLAYYRHADWLGSSRFASTTSRTMYSDTAYSPFGETYAASGTADPSFAGQNQDTVSGSYDSPGGQYSTQGRWPNSAPTGSAPVALENPQSHNRYAYALNNAVNVLSASTTDPAGAASPGSGASVSGGSSSTRQSPRSVLAGLPVGTGGGKPSNDPYKTGISAFPGSVITSLFTIPGANSEWSVTEYFFPIPGTSKWRLAGLNIEGNPELDEQQRQAYSNLCALTSELSCGEKEYLYDHGLKQSTAADPYTYYGGVGLPIPSINDPFSDPLSGPLADWGSPIAGMGMYAENGQLMQADPNFNWGGPPIFVPNFGGGGGSGTMANICGVKVQICL